MYIFRENIWKIRQIWSKLQLKLLFVKIEKYGKIDMDADMLLINHQSLIDIITLEAVYEKDIVWVAKKEIAKIPFYGHIVKAPKGIIIDRENKRGLIKLISQVKEKIEQKRIVAIFPEGTRGKGDRLLKFKNGAKLIAQKHNLRVQPIILINTRKILDTKNFMHNCGIIKVIYLDSIIANKDTDWFEKNEQKMNKIYNKEISNE